MPRPGGEADKFGNRYEGVWTVGNMVRLLKDEVCEITVEQFGDEQSGIEFRVQGSDNSCEVHSVKRQQGAGEWSLAALVSSRSNRRSILGDLFALLSAEPTTTAIFISATGANVLRELCERARHCDTVDSFERQLETSNTLAEGVRERLIPLAGTMEITFDFLRRLKVRLIDEEQLIDRVDDQLAGMVYRLDSSPVDSPSVRCVLADYVIDNLSRQLRADAVWAFLQERGYGRRDWTSDEQVVTVLNRIKSDFQYACNRLLVNGRAIWRSEAADLFAFLTSADRAQIALLSGEAGSGKSCVLAQLADALEAAEIPWTVVRMDSLSAVSSTRELGRSLELPASPIQVLANVSNGSRAVLILDQLDAVSLVSGRNVNNWQLVEKLLADIATHPNLRLITACRQFDLDNDHRLRGLKDPAIGAHAIALEQLSSGDVDRELEAAGVVPEVLNERQRSLLRVPLNLWLYLKCRPTGCGSFRGVFDLLHAYWDLAQQRIRKRNRTVRWADVCDRLLQVAEQRRALVASAELFDDLAEDLQAMCSEGVLQRDGANVRFSHETLHDYAFARRHVGRGGTALSLLHLGEQHLFRRGQLRHIMSYERGRNIDQYIADLEAVLRDPRIRFHIKKAALDWLSEIEDPSAQEWQLLAALDREKWNPIHVLRPLRGPHIGWFDRADEAGAWAGWLSSASDAIVDRAVELLTMPVACERRGARIAELLRPRIATGEVWRARLKRFFFYAKLHQSDDLVELLISAIAAGVIDDSL